MRDVAIATVLVALVLLFHEDCRRREHSLASAISNFFTGFVDVGRASASLADIMNNAAKAGINPSWGAKLRGYVQNGNGLDSWGDTLRTVQAAEADEVRKLMSAESPAMKEVLTNPGISKGLPESEFQKLVDAFKQKNLLNKDVVKKKGVAPVVWGSLRSAAGKNPVNQRALDDLAVKLGVLPNGAPRGSNVGAWAMGALVVAGTLVGAAMLALDIKRIVEDSNDGGGGGDGGWGMGSWGSETWIALGGFLIVVVLGCSCFSGLAYYMYTSQSNNG